MIKTRHIDSAFADFLSHLNLSEDSERWARLNVKLYAEFKQHVLEEYGITIDLNHDLDFFADSIEDDEAATMFKLRYG